MPLMGRERRIKRQALISRGNWVCEAMAGPRKVFRIEELAAMRLTHSIEDTQAALRHAEIMQALGALRALVTTASPRQSGKPDGRLSAETARLAGELNLIHGAISGTAPAHSGRDGAREPAADLTRIGHELNAVVNGAERATQRNSRDGRRDRPGGKQPVGRAQGRDRTRPRAGHPGPRDPDF